MTSLESDLIEILKGTMEADMGIYETGSIKVQSKSINKEHIDQALNALKQVNIDESRGKVKDGLKNAALNLFKKVPINKAGKEDINSGKWQKWSIATNLAACCFSLVSPYLAIGLCECCDPANPRDDQPPEKPIGLNQILSLWAIYNMALAYKDIKEGTDQTEKLLKKIEKSNFEKNQDEVSTTSIAALQWPTLIQLCEIHKDRQERTRFEQRKTKLFEKLKLQSNSNCNGENCNKIDCTIFSIFKKNSDDLIDKYKSYIAGSLFLLCQEYQILSMRANCRKKDKTEDKAKLLEVQGKRVCEAIQYINTDNNDSPLKCLKNKLYLIALMYIHEVLQSIGDASKEGKNDINISDIKKSWETISAFVGEFGKTGIWLDRLFPESFEWWPRIIKIIIPTIKNSKNDIINVLVEVLTTEKDVDPRKKWIQDKLEKIGLKDTKRNPTDGYDAVIQGIRNKICDESMKLRDSEDPETDKQIETYMKVVGRFNDQARNILKEWEIELIKSFLGCHQNKKESNKLDRWFMARLCARRRFLEEKDCYKNNNCTVWETGIDNDGIESRLLPIIKRLFNKMESENKRDIIYDNYLDNAIENRRKDFKERLRYHSHHKKMRDRFGVVCLRRWQSYTPALSAPQKVSRGGGYFIFITNDDGDVKKGVVIDPGIYFLENFIEEGFSIQDIDAVLLTHSHIDHRDDLESILTLLHESAENGAPKNIRIVVTQGAWDDIASMIRRSREHIDDIYTIEDKEADKDSERKIQNIANPILIEWEKAYHECFDADCVGYSLWKADMTSVKKFRFTGDTVYPAGGLGITNGNDVVMLNLGGLVSDNQGTDNKEWTLKKIKELTDHKQIKAWALETGFLENHLYLAGALQLLCDWKTKLETGTNTCLAVLCELPEELSGGHRKIIARAIQDSINYSDGKTSGNSTERIIVLPEDVGLRISYETSPGPKDKIGPQIECLYCSQHVKPEEIEVIPWGLEERLMFVCRNCKEAAAPYLLEEKFKHYRDRGRPFEKAES